MQSFVEKSFINGLHKELWKLEEKGIRVYASNKSFKYRMEDNQMERANAHYFTFNYQIIEDDLFKHAFVNGVNEKSIEEACKHCKKFMYRKINETLNKYTR